MVALKLLCGSLLTASSIAALASATSTALPKKFGILIFPGFFSIDIGGPLAYLNNIPPQYETSVIFITDNTTVQHSDTVNMTYPFGGINYQSNWYDLSEAPADLDVLLIPGGGGTRAISAGSRYDVFVKTTYPKLKYLMSVCTGASVLARSGVLDGRRATTNKAAWHWVLSQGDSSINWIAQARWVNDGNIWTSSGVEAGTDMANAFITSIFGLSVAQKISNTLEYSPITNSSYDPFAAVYNLTNSNPSSPSKRDLPADHGLISRPRHRKRAAVPLPGLNWAGIIFPGFVGFDLVSAVAYMEAYTPKFQVLGNMEVISTSTKVVHSAGKPGNPLPLGQGYVPSHSFASYKASLANSTIPLDLLIVPGLPTAGPFPFESEIIAFLREIAPKATRILSVGTGVKLLAEAGLLKGKRATAPKSLWKEITRPYSSKSHNVTWVSPARWVEDGKIWTASGTASGLDAGLAVIRELFGAANASTLGVFMEYLPSTNSTDDPFAAVWGVPPSG